MNSTTPRFALLALICSFAVFAQQAEKKPSQKKEESKPPASEKADYSQEAFLIEKLQTTARFNEDGTGSRDLLMRAKVQSESGVQQLGQLALGYNSASEKLNVDYVRVHKPDGSVVEAGPDSVQDLSAPVEREAPVYTDFRQKHVTVPGLRPGDTFEYKVTTQIHTPLATGHFWLAYDFTDHLIVLEETLTVVVPSSRQLKLKIRPEIKTVQASAGKNTIYTWRGQNLKREEPDEDSERPRRPRRKKPEVPAVQLTTFQNWTEVGAWYAGLERERIAPNDALVAKAKELTDGKNSDIEKIEALYNFVAKNFRYVSLSFGLGRYQPHAATEVLANQYGDCKDKHTLLAALLEASGFESYPVLINSQRKIDPDVPSPFQFDHVITAVQGTSELLWMDTTTEVAPFRMLSANLRKKMALIAPRAGAKFGPPRLIETPADPPFASTQLVEIEGKVSELGKLDAKLRYTMRGDGELPLRIAFRRTPSNQWKQLAQMISASDGVGGQVQDIRGGDPADTAKPFTMEMQVSQASFLDWGKKRAQVAVPVPSMGLPPAEDDPGADADPLELGSPVDVTMKLKLDFPEKFKFRVPVPVSVVRDYAEYRSDYKAEAQTFSLERVLRFKARELPVSRTRDYQAFSRAVRSDEAQALSVENASAGTAAIPESAKPEELYQAAITSLRNENPAQAVELLKRVAQLDPKHKQLWNTLGFAYFSAQSWDNAIAAFKKQIEADPYDENAYRNLALVYQRLQKYEEAVEALKKQLEVKPIDRAGQAMLGIVYREWRKYDEAASALEKAITLDPENSALHVNLGQAYLNLKQNEKALASFDRAVELDPSPTVWNNVAYELSVHKVHLDRALQYAESAVASTAADLRNVELSRVTMNDMRKVSALASYWDTLGWIHFQNGDLEKAEKYCRASWLLDFHGEVGDHLGQIAEKKGDRVAALGYYWDALSATRPVPETRERADSLASDKSLAEAVRKQHRPLPQELRTLSFGPLLKESLSAEFLLVLEADGQGGTHVTGIKFVKGSEKLRQFEAKIRSARFVALIPADNPTKLPRRGVLSCTGVSDAGCLFVLFPADTVSSVD